MTAMPAKMASTDTSLLRLVTSSSAAPDEADEGTDQDAEDLRLHAQQRVGLGVGMDQFDQQDADRPEDEDEPDDDHGRQHHQVGGRAIAEVHNTSHPRLTAASPRHTTVAHRALAV